MSEFDLLLVGCYEFYVIVMLVRFQHDFNILNQFKRLGNGYIRYSLFDDADTGIIYPKLPSQHHVWPSVACGIAVLHVHKFPYPRQQTGGSYW